MKVVPGNPYPNLMKAIEYDTEQKVEFSHVLKVVDELSFANIANELDVAKFDGLKKYLRQYLTNSEGLNQDWEQMCISTEDVILSELAIRMLNRYTEKSIYYRAYLRDIVEYEGALERYLIDQEDNTNHPVTCALSKGEIDMCLKGKVPFIPISAISINFLGSRYWRERLELSSSDNSGILILVEFLEALDLVIIRLPNALDM